MKDFKFDHINLSVGSDDRALTFFRDVLGFQTGYRPPFPFAGEWLYSGGQAVIHTLFPHGKNERVKLGHVAFRSEECAAEIVNRIERLGLNYRLAFVPENGEKQIFVDFDDLAVEIVAPTETVRKIDVERIPEQISIQSEDKK